MLENLIEDLPLSYRLRTAKGTAQGLVILLHGVGSNEQSMAGLAALLPEDIHVVLVRSPIQLGPSSYCAFQVNFTANGPQINAEAAASSRLLLADFIPKIQQRLGVNPSQTIIAGFSQGGIMSAGLALCSPELVRGFAILSGRILPEITPFISTEVEELKKLSALVLHGTEDATLPIAWADKSIAWLEQLGIQLLHHRYSAQHEITSQMAHDFVEWTTITLK